jgi:pyruvate formate lyase activating enzyme
MVATERLALVKNTFSDYPGKIACALFLKGCNLRCPYCQNSNLALGRDDDTLVFWSEAAKFLQSRAGIIPAAVISGGEALLHPALPELIAFVKNLGYAVKLDINGSLPGRLAKVLDTLDYIAMDLKTEAHLRLTGFTPEAQAESLELLNASGKEFEVRSVVAPDFCGRAELAAVAGKVKASKALLWRLLPFRPGGCLDAGFNALPGCPESFLKEMQLFLTAEHGIAIPVIA